MENKDDELRDACFEAYLIFETIGDPTYSEIKSKLEYVVGSYNYDKNPVGLFEIGGIALKQLKDIRKKSPKAVNKKVVDDLEKSLKR
jgi:hypothetical protein